jgi:hypothetical protein
MTTKTRLFALALAAATITTASLVADTASARPGIPSANAINKVPTLLGHAFVAHPSYPGGGSGRKDNAGSDNSTRPN